MRSPSVAASASDAFGRGCDDSVWPMNLRAFLLDAGATEAEIERADGRGLVAAARARPDVDARTRALRRRRCRRGRGHHAEVAARIWRALGFPDVPDGVDAFSDRDARALRFVARAARRVRCCCPTSSTRCGSSSASLARLAAFEADLVADALDALARDGRRRGDGRDGDGRGGRLETRSPRSSTTRTGCCSGPRCGAGSPGRPPVRRWARGRLRRPRRLHRAVAKGSTSTSSPSSLARFEALAYDTVAREQRAHREDDRRRGDVRRRAARGRGASRSRSPSAVAADPELPDVQGRCRLRIGRSPATATSTARSSTSPAGITGRARRGNGARVRAAAPRSSPTTPSSPGAALGSRRIRGIGEVELFVLRRER